jgi:hypothetical protein
MIESGDRDDFSAGLLDGRQRHHVMPTEVVHNDSTRAEGCVEAACGLGGTQPTSAAEKGGHYTRGP